MKETVTITTWNQTLPVAKAAETIKIYFWNVGLLIVGIDSERQIAFAKSFTFDQTIHNVDLESLLLDEPALGGGEPVTHVYLSSDKSMLVPKQVYEPSTSPDWIRQIHDVNYDDAIIATPIAKPASYAVNVINQPILNVLKETFADALIDNINPLFLPYIAPEKPTLLLSIMDNMVVYAYYFEQKLIQHQIEYGVNTSAILLSINAHFEHLNVAQDDINIQLQGYGNAFAEVHAFLADYFQVQTLTDTSFFNHLIVCE